MLEQIVAQIILMKSLIIITAVSTVFLTVFCLIYCRTFGWNRSNIKVIGFFYDMGMQETFVLAVCMLKLFLILSLLFNKGRIETVHICFFGVLVLIYNLCRRKAKDMLVSIFNGGVIMGVLFVANLLISYLREVLFEVKIAFALVLLAIFLILYAAYDVGYCVLSIVESRNAVKEDKRDKTVKDRELKENET